MQKAFQEAVRKAGIQTRSRQPATHSATHLLVQELLGHSSVKTTMIYTHVLNRGGRGVLSPIDQL
jgi:site-specific recombinase XerD